ncbi:MAG: hypothetical protein KDD40_01710 [Bdellovibrionales bacterium]|nr:hypothetical protein [Bdellovibrionales bacterium]
MTSLLKKIFIALSLWLLVSPSHAKLMSEYTEKTGKLNILETKIRESKANIKARLKALDHTKDKEKKKELYDSLVAEHEELKKNIKDYNKIRQELKYKFPQKNDQTQRRYLPMREMSLKEIETESGLDGLLNRVKKKMDKKYKKFTLADDNKNLKPDGKKEKQEKSKDKITLER